MGSIIGSLASLGGRSDSKSTETSGTEQVTSGPVEDITVSNARASVLRVLDSLISGSPDLSVNPMFQSIQAAAQNNLLTYLRGGTTVTAEQRTRLADIASESVRLGTMDLDEARLQTERGILGNLAERNLGPRGGGAGDYLRAEANRAYALEKGKLVSAARIAQIGGEAEAEKSNIANALASINAVLSGTVGAATAAGGIIASAPYGVTTKKVSAQTGQEQIEIGEARPPSMSLSKIVGFRSGSPNFNGAGVGRLSSGDNVFPGGGSGLM